MNPEAVLLVLEKVEPVHPRDAALISLKVKVVVWSQLSPCITAWLVDN
jgi:hypothetical protein